MWSKGEDVFISRGYTNWKDASVEKRGFGAHERSQFHKYSVELTLKPQRDVGDLLSSQYEQERKVNRAYLRKILENEIFLARQGLPMRGNWLAPAILMVVLRYIQTHQLLLRAKDDPTILDIMQCRTRKYTDHHIQNELLQILALGHLRKIASSIRESGYFALEADEVTDVSNKELILLRH